MYQLSSRCMPFLIGMILTLSVLAQVINYLYYQFPGNNYFPENTLLSFLLLFIIYIGLILIFGKNSNLSRQGRELLYFFGIMSIIAFATNAVQLTPFAIIDKHIIALEAQLHIDMASIVIWTNDHSWFKYFLMIIYDSLPYQMSLIPLFIIATKRFNLLREYYFLILCTVFFGFLFYYFFPTTAPASNVTSSLFSEYQLATGIKFNQIHHHINPTTNEGGLIALPSFHAIWALLCIYLFKEWLVPCIVLTVVNLFLILSCILLGWHYPLDILGGIVILVLSYYLMLRCAIRF